MLLEESVDFMLEALLDFEVEVEVVERLSRGAIVGASEENVPIRRRSPCSSSLKRRAIAMCLQQQPSVFATVQRAEIREWERGRYEMVYERQKRCL